jgi:hypothetical protein
VVKATGQDCVATPHELFITGDSIYLVMERAYCSLDACLSVTVRPTTHPPPCTVPQTRAASLHRSKSIREVHPSSVDAWDKSTVLAPAAANTPHSNRLLA